jgi:hypothetical protein
MAQVGSPLHNPALLAFELPIASPQVWLRLTDAESAQRAVRTEIVPRMVQPVGDRTPVRVKAVAAVPGPEPAYIAFVDEHTFPEREAYWTRGTRRGRILVAPGGARELVVNLQNGPVNNTIHVTVASQAFSVSLRPYSTGVVTADVSPSAAVLTVDVEASASFRPFDVDSQSADRRDLGCQVRIELR